MAPSSPYGEGNGVAALERGMRCARGRRRTISRDAPRAEIHEAAQQSDAAGQMDGGTASPLIAGVRPTEREGEWASRGTSW